MTFRCQFVSSGLLVLGLSFIGQLAAQSLPLVLQFDEARVVASGRISDLGDVDGDGADDFCVDLVGVNTWDQRQAVISGRSGVALFEPRSWTFNNGSHDGWIKLPDMDGDGLAEFGTLTLPFYTDPHSQIRIFSGATLSQLSFHAIVGLGMVFADVGDVTGNGYPDLGVAYVNNHYTAQYNAVPVSRIDIIEGFTFQRTTDFVMYFNANWSCGGLVAVGDVDGDGRDDFASASGKTNVIYAGGGSASVYSGMTGQIIRSWLGGPGDALGEKMVSVGDLDFDNKPELALFSPGSDVAGPNAGRVEIMSAVFGTRLIDIQPAPGEKFTNIFAAKDHDGDGFQDLVLEILDTASMASRREIRSLVTNQIIRVLAPNEEVVGDLNGDLIADRIRVSPGQPTASQTRVEGLVSLGAQSYGNIVGGPSFLWQPNPAAPALGNMKLSTGMPFTPIVGVVSFASANTLVNGTNLPLFVSDAPTDLYGFFYSQTDAQGDHLDPINLAQPGLAGIKVFVQYGVLSAAPQTTNALELMFGPF